jgi:molecular chaperone DnaK (HSP70)
MFVGIDLGTTNTTLSYALQNEGPVDDLSIAQLVSAGTLESRPSLPSFLYVPSRHEFGFEALSLPWDEVMDFCVGTMARDEGGKVPDRLVSSAKSWLSQQMLDPREPILPWKAPDEVAKLSAIDVSTRYLKHLTQAFRYAKIGSSADGSPVLGESLEDQSVFLTVPASFNAVARELTVEAARRAGLDKLVLLEEPQAAFYSWLHTHTENWRTLVSTGDRVLVCDVGGGTCDFSLISVTNQAGNLELDRLAVGEHLLLGGDNMDLAVAMIAQKKLKEQGHKLDSWQFQALVHSCRSAKERLMAPGGLELCNVTIPGRGTKLMGGSISTELRRSEVETMLMDGFFPACVPAEVGPRERRLGLSEVGLSFESDPAVTRQLARFLQTIPEAVPNRILFNGGVFRSPVLRNRLLSVVQGWNPEASLTELSGVDLDRGVCRGAAYYGQVREGSGIRIRSGTTKAYYISVEVPRPAIPGFAPPTKAVCIAPVGMEEGTQEVLKDLKFHLAAGDNLQFPFLVSGTRTQDQLGDSIEDWEDDTDIEPLTSIQAHIKSDNQAHMFPVQIESRLSEVGTLELYCKEQNGANTWKLEFGVRNPN